MLTLSFRGASPLQLHLPFALPRHASLGYPSPANLAVLSQRPETALPPFVRESPVALKYLRLLGSLDWMHFPERPDQRFHPQDPPLPYACLAAAYLVKLDLQLPYVADLRQYLVEHPSLVWVLGFPRVLSRAQPWGFDVNASLPTHRHLSRLLRTLPNNALQFLLDETVRLLRAELDGRADNLGDCVALDTKHIIAWVKENNPKAYVRGKRYDKHQQPAGDPDCRLGCKRKSNQHSKKGASPESLPLTPTKNPVPAQLCWLFMPSVLIIAAKSYQQG